MLPVPEKSDERLYNVMKKCWQKDPENRPDMKWIVENLNDILNTERKEAEVDEIKSARVLNYYKQKDFSNYQNLNV
jgi:hypothetical protein